MEKRVRSPNYPAISLAEAVHKVGLVYKNQHTHGAPRDVVVKSMGYNSVNGASATAFSALIKYGLLDGRGDEIKVSDRAMQILHPQNQAEKADALRIAASEPTLFHELDERFPGKLPAEEVLRNYLARLGFAPAAVPAVILAYRETKEFVERESGGYDSQTVAPIESAPMQSYPLTSANQLMAQTIVKTVGSQRAIAQYPFENGGMLQIVVTGDISTEEALDWAQTLIELKRKEIARNAARGGSPKQDEN